MSGEPRKPIYCNRFYVEYDADIVQAHFGTPHAGKGGFATHISIAMTPENMFEFCNLLAKLATEHARKNALPANGETEAKP